MLLRRDILQKTARGASVLSPIWQPHQEQTLTAGVVINTGETNYKSSVL